MIVYCFGDVDLLRIDVFNCNNMGNVVVFDGGEICFVECGGSVVDWDLSDLI